MIPWCPLVSAVGFQGRLRPQQKALVLPVHTPLTTTTQSNHQHTTESLRTRQFCRNQWCREVGGNKNSVVGKQVGIANSVGGAQFVVAWADGVLAETAGGAMMWVAWADGLLLSWVSGATPSNEMAVDSPEHE